MTAFNQSRIKMFRRCQRQYSFRYDSWKQWDAPPDSEMVPRTQRKPLYKGTWLHALQEAHHRAWAVDSGFAPELVYPDGEVELWTDVHARMKEEYDQLFEEEKEEIGDLPGECKRLFRSYLRRWKDDKDHYRVAPLDDGSPAIEFVITAELPEGVARAPFKGRIDLVVEDIEYGGLWIWDSKWVRSIPASDERMMSPQSPMYVWAMKQDGYDLRGFVFNYGRSKAPVIPRVLRDGTLTMRARMDTDYATYLTAIKEQHGKHWKEWAAYHYLDKLRDLKDREKLWFDRQRIPVEQERIDRALDEFLATIADIKSRNMAVPPRTYTYSCKTTCAYHDPCVAEFTGLDIEPLIKAKYTFEGERYGDPENLLAD